MLNRSPEINMQKDQPPFNTKPCPECRGTLACSQGDLGSRPECETYRKTFEPLFNFRVPESTGKSTGKSTGNMGAVSREGTRPNHDPTDGQRLRGVQVLPEVSTTPVQVRRSRRIPSLQAKAERSGTVQNRKGGRAVESTGRGPVRRHSPDHVPDPSPGTKPHKHLISPPLSAALRSSTHTFNFRTVKSPPTNAGTSKKGDLIPVTIRTSRPATPVERP